MIEDEIKMMRLVTLLTDGGRPMNENWLFEAVNLPSKEISAVCAALQKKGRIKRKFENGRYVLSRA